MDPPQQLERREGIAAILRNQDNKVLVGKRTGSHGADTWGLPGGHPEPEKDGTGPDSKGRTAAREVWEETGLLATAEGRIAAMTADVFAEIGRCYDTFFINCAMRKDSPTEPEVKEKDKCKEWAWMSWEELAELKEGTEPDEVLFRPLYSLLDKYPNFEDLRPVS